MLKKKKYFKGLLYKKTNLLTSESIYRFLGIKIADSKVNILKSEETIYLNLFIRFCIWKRKNRKAIQENYMEYIVSKYPGFDNYIVFSSGFGEIFHFFFYLKQYLKKEKIFKNSLLIFHREGLNTLYKLFNIEVKAVVEKTIEGIMLDKVSKYKNARFITPLNLEYFGEVEKKIVKQNLHYYEALRSTYFFNLNNAQVSLPTLKSDYVIDEFVKNTLKKYVILCPEASTLEFLPQDFWYKIAKKLMLAGFEVVINTNNPSFVIENCISSFNVGLSVKEIFQLSKQASAIIGLRSGFLEMLAQISCKNCFIIYNAFNKFAQNNLTAEDVVKGFSIKKLPNINSNLIYEFIFDSYENYIDLVDEIISYILLRNKSKDPKRIIKEKQC